MKSIFLLILTAATIDCYAQRLSAFVSLGLGSSIENNIEGCSRQNRARLVGSMSFYYQMTQRFSMGVEVMSSGPFNLMGGSNCNIDNPAENKLTLDPSNPKAGTYLLRSKMLLMNYKEMEPYIGMGVGVNTFYQTYPTNDVEKVRRTTFVVSPEIGVNIYKFQFACKLILGGKTPTYNGMEPTGNRTVIMESIKAQQVYLTIGYQLVRL